MIVIVCGGRVGRNLSKRRVYEVLDRWAAAWISEGIKVVTGGAKWVDTWAVDWAKDRGHDWQVFAIDGELDGYKFNAPFNRNRRMNREAVPDCCLGFPGGGGTNDMMDICHASGVPVGDIEINDNGTWEIKWWPQK
jgi:hypothetical protein